MRMPGHSLSNKWRERFDRFEKAEPYGFLKFRSPSQLKWTDKHSAWGFIFGPFFYFFKGAWQKGLLLLAAIFLYCSGLDILAYLLGITIDEKIYGIPGEVVCALFVNYDVYLLHTKNETMWPSLRVFASPAKVAISAVLSLSLFLVCAFKLGPDINEVMVAAVSGKWHSEPDSAYLEIALAEGRGHLKINNDAYPVKIETANTENLVLKNQSPAGMPSFSFLILWDSAEKSFRLKWIKGSGRDVLLDYEDAAEK
jgi:hypothetical protein